jgi:hypothetical protein
MEEPAVKGMIFAYYKLYLITGLPGCLFTGLYPGGSFVTAGRGYVMMRVSIKINAGEHWR